MDTPRTEKEKMKSWLENWRVVSEEMEKEKITVLRALTATQSAEIFDGMDCDPATVWKPEERIHSSGLVEQQRIFARGHRDQSNLPRRA